MRLPSHLRALLTLAPTALLLGCNVPNPFYAHTDVITAQRAPLGGPEGPAKQSVFKHSDFVRTRSGMRWVDSEGEQHEAPKLARQFHERLGRVPLQAVNASQPDGSDSPETFSSRVTIVCVNPPVAILEPVQVTAGKSGLRSPIPLFEFWMVAPGWYTLPYGVESGRSTKTREGTTWINLESFNTPRPIEPGEDGRALLPVPWGYLVLSPDGKGWRVEPLSVTQANFLSQ